MELYYYGHAHTPGDIVIYLPQDQILFAGDLLWFGFFPNVREANVPNQIKVVNRILEFPVKYYVPGHGHISDEPGRGQEDAGFPGFALWKCSSNGQRRKTSRRSKPFEEA